MLNTRQTKTFKKNLKKYRHNKNVLKELSTVIKLLVNNTPVPPKYNDHELTGKFKGIRELHLKPDDLLLYIKEDKKEITLVAIGSHSEIF